ncbi:D-alanyl-D-alanine carboxypeptidase family protein [Arthrobacter sp. PAMC25284]|uniref:M15 family metallopeptidase n=1 Tax=Arthrobacter sp. PAMC25284 TaxID=2861279 RepID=UPI001C62F425|nr:M15 family metallopeptidase [Arthrobacter sp. PAMC25284]QYF89511.1 M15 family metallopeptidase [Arthrobacter sp. PAMC25284]
MCHNRAAGPSRRAFARFLAAGSGLAAATACSPGAPPLPAAATPAPVASTAAAAAAPTATEAATTPPPGPAATDEAATPAPATGVPASAPPGKQHSLVDPASPWVIVNKRRPLIPAAFEPADLVQPRIRLASAGAAALLNSTTAAAAEEMFAAAAADGITMTLASGYRSYATQTATYANYVNTRGQVEADTASARPGYSEHQTGWSFDIGDGSGACGFMPCFAKQPSAAWAAASGHRFGFVVRYPWMFHGTTGYYYEPWHLRFIGVEAATDMKNRGVDTLEEYFGLDAAPAYP